MTGEAVRKFSLFPKKLGQCVEPLTRPVFKTRGLAGSRLMNEWEKIAGPEMARHALPEKLSFPRGGKTDGTLTIAVENGFATELQHLLPLILERLAVYFGYNAVTRIVISHAWLPPPAPKTAAAPAAALPAESIAAAGEATDAELRQALQSLARTLAGSAT